MSAEATGYVWKHSPYTGAKLLVHLAIADIVNDLHDDQFWMGMQKLGNKARVSRSTAQEAVHQLVKDGYLVVVEPPVHDQWRPTLYRMLYPGRPESGRGCPEETPEGARSGGTPLPGERAQSQVGSQVDPKGGGSTRRWRVVPPATELTEDRRRMAREEGLRSEQSIEAEWRKFKRHEFTKPRTNVDTTWQNWCAKEATWNGVEPESDPNKEKRRAAVLASQADYQQRLAASRATRREPSEPIRLATVLKDLGL